MSEFEALEAGIRSRSYGSYRLLRQIGGSLNVSIPRDVVKALQLRAGDEVEVVFNGKFITIFPVPKMDEHAEPQTDCHRTPKTGQRGTG